MPCHIFIALKPFVSSNDMGFGWIPQLVRTLARKVPDSNPITGYVEVSSLHTTHQAYFCTANYEGQTT